MKIAIVHDYIKEMGGAERVLLVLSQMYPEAPIYTAFADKKSYAYQQFKDTKILESKFGWILGIGKLYSYLRFLLPFVWKSLDLSEYDLIITSCSGYIARGFRVSSKAKVVAYCHTPPRWLYGYETPTGAQKSWWGKIYLWFVGPYMRYFDYQSAQRINLFVANSREVAMRIKKFYRKEASVIYPPCDVLKNSNTRNEQSIRGSIGQGYWLIVSRIVGGKGIEQAIKIARKTGEKLVIVGTGPLQAELMGKTAKDRMIYWMGYVKDEDIGPIYAGAKGFLALARDEDFGISVVEANAFGVPVLAYAGGGYLETVVDTVNGILVDNDDSLVSEMKKWDRYKWEKKKIIQSVSKFSRQRFEKEFELSVKALLTTKQ